METIFPPSMWADLAAYERAQRDEAEANRLKMLADSRTRFVNSIKHSFPPDMAAILVDHVVCVADENDMRPEFVHQCHFPHQGLTIWITYRTTVSYNDHFTVWIGGDEQNEAHRLTEITANGMTENNMRSLLAALRSAPEVAKYRRLRRADD